MSLEQSFPVDPVIAVSVVASASMTIETAAPGQSLSPTSVDDSSPYQDSDVDAQLIEALRSGKDRLFVLKLGESMEGLIKERNVRSRFELQPSSTYHRLLVHRCAAYYKLTPETEPGSKTIAITVADESRIPARRVAELVPADDSPLPAFKIMRRNIKVRANSKASSLNGSGNEESGPGDLSDGDPSEGGSSRGSRRKPLTMSERQAQYDEARQRIFKSMEEREKEKQDATASSSTTSLVSASSSGGAGGETSNPGGSIDDDDREFIRDKSGRRALPSNSRGGFRQIPPTFTPLGLQSGYSYPSLYDPGPSDPNSYQNTYHPTPAPPTDSMASSGLYQGPVYPMYQFGSPPYVVSHYPFPYYHYPPPGPPQPREGAEGPPNGSPGPAPSDPYAPSYVWSAPPGGHQSAYSETQHHPPSLSQPQPPVMHNNHPSSQSLPPPPQMQPEYPLYMMHSPYGHAQPPQGYLQTYTPPPNPHHLTPSLYQNVETSAIPRSQNSLQAAEFGPPQTSRQLYDPTAGRGHGNPQSRNGRPHRGKNSWSHGNVSGNTQGSTLSRVGERMIPRAEPRRTTSSGSSTSLNNGQNVRALGDETSSIASSSTSTSSSSSRQTFTSTSSKHPLPPRPDWAVGLKPTLRHSNSHHSSSSSHGSRHSHSRQSQHSTDFPPLPMSTGQEKRRPAIGGVWGSSSIGDNSGPSVEHSNSLEITSISATPLNGNGIAPAPLNHSKNSVEANILKDMSSQTAGADLFSEPKVVPTPTYTPPMGDLAPAMTAALGSLRLEHRGEVSQDAT